MNFNPKSVSSIDTPTAGTNCWDFS